LGHGAHARLYDALVDDSTRSLLRSIGLVDACELRVCQCGDPVVVQVHTTRIGMSRAVAARLYVVPTAASDPDDPC
jgi:Fe2+ transport system protein FeoA